jgi:hypothetical protein
MPASRAPAGIYSAWHAHDESLDELARYRTPTLPQGLTKALPLFLSSAKVVEFRVALMHELFKVPPHVFNRVEIW